MKLPEIKGIIEKVHPVEPMGDKGSVKQTFVLKIPGRKYTDEWGEEKTTNEERFEMDVINNKIPSDVMLSLQGKKVVIEQSYLNGYEFENEEGEKRLGKSISVIKLKEHK
jgi:hypothetical protein